MSEATHQRVMPEDGRALITQREREIISGEADVSDNYEYKVRSTVRNRIRKHLGGDIELLAEHFPEAHDLVRDIVCSGEDD